MKKNKTGQLIKNEAIKDVATMKKETKAARRLIQDKVTDGVDAIKEETSVVMHKVKEAASTAKRKEKAAVRAIKS
jgi:hypothetical protein